jgi:hypothetical protein
LESHKSKRTKRNKISSKKKTKQRQSEARRQRTTRKNSMRRQCKRNPPPDEGHDSSSLSSNSSSSSSLSSSAYTTSSDDKSVLAFGSHKITNVTDIVSKEKQRQTSTRIGKEVKKLTAAAKVYDLRPFYTDRGTIEQRKTHFVHWATKLGDMLAPIHRYNAFMRDFPKLNHAELTFTANTALGLFLRLKLGSNSMHPIEEAIGHTNKITAI